jgi:hypothetical protein
MKGGRMLILLRQKVKFRSDAEEQPVFLVFSVAHLGHVLSDDTVFF